MLKPLERRATHQKAEYDDLEEPEESGTDTQREPPDVLKKPGGQRDQLCCVLGTYVVELKQQVG